MIWGLRDYGTGEWEGGDSDCDHAKWKAWADAKKQPDSATYSQFRDICGKCGARRVDQQLGLEPTPDHYVARMVEVFREVRRVLAKHGTCWVNLGDSYASAWACDRRNVVGAGSLEHGKRDDRPNRLVGGLKEKDLVGIPWRVAFALQADGWYLRSDIIWSKPNPMPESVTDRPTKAHEYVFLLTKQPRYWFDQEAVREPFSGGTHSRGTQIPRETPKNAEPGSGIKNNRSMATAIWKQAAPPPPQVETLDGSDGEAPRGADGRRVTHVEAGEGSVQHRNGERWPGTARNVRSVWEIATQPYPEAHFATFPEELARRCILAGCPERVCRVCGRPSERIVERGESDYERLRREQGHDWRDMDAAGLARGVITRPGEGGQTRTAHGTVPSLRPAETTTLGWSDCGHNNYRPGIVLDPFLGSGTVALVARNHGRHAIGIELSREYAELAAKRTRQLSLLAT